MTYSEKLLDPRWQKKRLEIFERDSFTCRFCGNKEKTLAVHHTIYRKAHDPWDYENETLLTLCDDGCHEQVTETLKDVSVAVAITPEGLLLLKRIVGLCAIGQVGHIGGIVKSICDMNEAHFDAGKSLQFHADLAQK